MSERTVKLLKHYIPLWVLFTLIFTLAALGVELLEGNKITTTEYYGLRNLGFVIVFLQWIATIIVYPIVAFPLTLLLNWLVRSKITTIIIFTALGALFGNWIFYKEYGYFLDYGYQLHVISSIIIYAIAALLYGVINAWLKKKAG